MQKARLEKIRFQWSGCMWCGCKFFIGTVPLRSGNNTRLVFLHQQRRSACGRWPSLAVMWIKFSVANRPAWRTSNRTSTSWRGKSAMTCRTTTKRIPASFKARLFKKYTGLHFSKLVDFPRRTRSVVSARPTSLLSLKSMNAFRAINFYQVSVRNLTRFPSCLTRRVCFRTRNKTLCTSNAEQAINTSPTWHLHIGWSIKFRAAKVDSERMVVQEKSVV